MDPSSISLISREFDEHIALASKTVAALDNDILRAADACLAALRDQKKLIFFGNGGSAADADHLAAEFTGKYQLVRKGLPALSLSSGAAAMTSIGNDFGFESVFSRQLEALAVSGDVCIGISTSGRSPNVTYALERAKIMGCTTIALTGRDGGEMLEFSDIALVVPSDITSRIQEIHILIGHIICNLVETRI